jgi:hypothetical protein
MKWHNAAALASWTGGVVDHAILPALRRRFATAAPRSGEDQRALIAELIAHYDQRHATFFATPPRAEVSVQRHAQLSDGEIVDLAWPSRYQPT